MPKVDIKRLDSTTANDITATKTINDNFKALQEGVEDALSRTGKVPNYMDTDFDLNHNKIINVADPVEDRDAVPLKYFRDNVGDAKKDADRAYQNSLTAKKYADSASIWSSIANNHRSDAEMASARANEAAFRAEESANKALTAAPLTFTDRWIPSTEWYEDYLLSPNYLYSTYIPLEGVKESMIPFVTLPVEIALLGTLAPVAITVDGGLYLYAQEIPQDFNLPSIVCIETGTNTPPIPDDPVVPGTGQYDIDYDTVTVVNDLGELSILQNDKGSYTVLEGFSDSTGFWFNAAPSFGNDLTLEYQFKFRLNDNNREALGGTVVLGNFQNSTDLENTEGKIYFTSASDADLISISISEPLKGTSTTYLDTTQIIGEWVTVNVRVNEEGNWQVYADKGVVDSLTTTNANGYLTIPINYYLLFANPYERTPAISVDLEEVGFKQNGEWIYRAAKEIL